MMTTAVLENATRDAFKQRYRDRPWHRYDSQPGPVKDRWAYVVALVLGGTITSGRDFRAKYLEGFAGTDALKTWSQISAHERSEWSRVYDAAARHASEPSHRMTKAVTMRLKTERRAA